MRPCLTLLAERVGVRGVYEALCQMHTCGDGSWAKWTVGTALLRFLYNSYGLLHSILHHNMKFLVLSEILAKLVTESRLSQGSVTYSLPSHWSQFKEPLGFGSKGVFCAMPQPSGSSSRSEWVLGHSALV